MSNAFVDNCVVVAGEYAQALQAESDESAVHESIQVTVLYNMPTGVFTTIF